MKITPSPSLTPHGKYLLYCVYVHHTDYALQTLSASFPGSQAHPLQKQKTAIVKAWRVWYLSHEYDVISKGSEQKGDILYCSTFNAKCG